QEFTELFCRYIDLESPRVPDVLRHAIAADVVEANGPMETAYRGHTRWVPCYEQISHDRFTAPLLRPEGVYLITGGLGRVGLSFARYLAQSAKARLVLIGRNSEQQAKTDAVRAELQELRSLGAEVLPVSADVADPAAISAAVLLTIKTFGSLHGVIHAA